MNIICAPNGIVDPNHQGQGVMDIRGAEFEDVLLDTSIFCSEKELEKIFQESNDLNSKIMQFHDEVIKENLHTTIAYAPYLSRNIKKEDVRELPIKLIEDSIEACKSVGCQYIIVKPLETLNAEDVWERNKAYYLHLATLVKNTNLKILLVNRCKDINGHLIRGICSDGKTAAKWVDQLNDEVNEECFGFCMDVGISNICGQNMFEFIQALGNRLKAVIIRDCDGNKDNAMLPFTCVNKGQSQTDWLSLIRGLREIGFDGHFIMDFEDTARAFSPILRPNLMQVAKSIAEYFKWQIDIEERLKKYNSIVLFGAGNMCRNYMKCYGDKYPPLFTCDNNSALWEKSFCGLEVKSPEHLQDLPENCGIFICSIYYREIEKQLMDMGVKNIEFFNDEYMPSFYYDRLEVK